VSVVIGIAVDRNEFPDLDTLVLSFFEPGEVANFDDRKRRMTIRHLLTMSTGLDWNEDLPYTDPENAFAIMALSKDWVQYTIDRPMAENPGEAYQYNSGATLILGQVFRKATGFDLEEYALKYLFAPLGIDHYFWKRTPMGLVDTQEGLYVTSRDIAKIAYLILMRGQWDGQQVVSEEWVKASVKPSLNVTDDHSIQYGYKWWLYNYQYKGEDRVAIAGSGFGGQAPIVLPELDIVLVFTGWNILPDRPRIRTGEAINRILEAVREP
jgi:CubicO group peptidase (beta-lactamase class C family)